MVEYAKSALLRPDAPIGNTQSTKWAWVKLALLAIIILPDLATFPSLLDRMGWVPFLRVPAAFACLMLGLIAAAFTQSNILRIVFALLFSAGMLLIQGYRFAVGEPTRYFNFVTTIDARSAFADAFAMHNTAFITAGLFALLCFVAIAIKPPALTRKWSWSAPLLVLTVYGALVAALIDRQGNISGIPAAWHGVGYTTLYAIDMTQGSSGLREPVAIRRTGPMPKGDIVLIIDESVAGHYLDLNASGGARSGLTDPSKGWRTTDFGIAASPSNCSMQSNVVLRFGGQRGDYKQKVARSPSIWAYARKVGLKTVYMYGQRGGLNENFMTDAEREEIDEARYFREIDPPLRDHHIAKALAGYLANDTPEFILINKVGAHFPLTWASPQAAVLAKKLGLRKAAKDAEFWRKYRGYYREAVAWAVGDFFDLALDSDAGSSLPATILYTSDHGQTFYERAAPGSVTHCRNNAVAEEGSVPLVVIERGKAGPVNWDASIAMRHDSSSALRIFPSLLLTMGYDPVAVRAKYGSSLADADTDPMTFGVNMAMKQGAEPRWIKVDPAKIFRPYAPASDLAQSNIRPSN